MHYVKILFLSLKIIFLFLLPENSDLSLMLVYSKFLFPGFSVSVSYLNHILTFFYFCFYNFIVHLSCCKPHPLFWNCVLPPCPSLHRGNSLRPSKGMHLRACACIILSASSLLSFVARLVRSWFYKVQTHY